MEPPREIMSLWRLLTLSMIAYFSRRIMLLETQEKEMVMSKEETMKSIRRAIICSAFVALTMAIGASLWAQDYAGRKELKRADLSGAPGMEVVLSVVEMKPGDQLPLHIHHGIETAYVLEGGRVEVPGKPPLAMPIGAPIMALRDVEHGFTVVGDKTIKLVTVHIVDKGKPLYDWIKK
jgi:quercetin dioxygenase-like cupin family protein